MNDYELKAFVTNLGKYNEGELVGEWVSFPVSADEMKAILDRIQIGHPDDFGVPYEEIFITDYDTDIYGLQNLLGEFTSLEELNYLAGRLDEMSTYEIDKFKAVLESGIDIEESGLSGIIWNRGSTLRKADSPVSSISHTVSTNTRSCRISLTSTISAITGSMTAVFMISKVWARLLIISIIRPLENRSLMKSSGCSAKQDM